MWEISIDVASVLSILTSLHVVTGSLIEKREKGVGPSLIRFCKWRFPQGHPDKLAQKG